MKSLVSVLGVLLISSTSLAVTQVECKLNVLVANKAGYVVPTDTITLSDKLDTRCNARGVLVDKDQVSICAVETGLVGVISVNLIVDAKKHEDSTSSEVLVGTDKSDKTSLVVIRQDYNVNGNFSEKMFAAGLDFPRRYDGGDSLQLDDAVKAGINKGALTHGEPVVITIDSCILK